MTTDLPSVSIGIPFYNAELTLLDAVRSVFAQTHQNWELILIDDGSTDHSLEIARSIKDPRVRVYSDGENYRLAARLNQMTRLANHSYIARMDADDMMAPNRIEKLLTFLYYNPGYDLVSCGVYSIADDNSLRGVRGNSHSQYTFEGLWKKQQHFLHAGLIARKDWYDRNHYEESLPVGQDTDLWLRAAKANDFKGASLAEPLYMYREGGNVTPRKLHSAYQLERTRIAPLICSMHDRFLYVTKSCAKTAAVHIMARTGTLRYLLKRRNNVVIDDQVLKVYEDLVSEIRATKIPGIDL